MADLKIVLDGVHIGMDGEYPLDPESLTNRDLHDIKRLSGIRPGEFQEAVEAADSDLVLAFAVIALRRAGKPYDENALWDAPAGKIQIVGEPDAVPPAETTSSENGSISDRSSGLSGSGSKTDSGLPETGQSRTGLPSSEPATSGSGT